MEKWVLIRELVSIFLWIIRDSDGDGRPDITDSDPQNPDVQ